MACGRSVKLEFQQQRNVAVGLRLAWKFFSLWWCHRVSRGDQGCLEIRKHPTLRWFPLMCHGGRRTRCVVGNPDCSGRPPRIGALHLLAMGHRPKLLWLSRSERFDSQNPRSSHGWPQGRLLVTRGRFRMARSHLRMARVILLSHPDGGSAQSEARRRRCTLDHQDEQGCLIHNVHAVRIRDLAHWDHRAQSVGSMLSTSQSWCKGRSLVLQVV